MPLRVILLWIFLAAHAVCAEVFVDNNLSQVLRNTSANTELNVIVRLKNRPGFSTDRTTKFSRPAFLADIRANASYGRDRMKSFFKANPTSKMLPLWHINGFVLTEDAGTVQKLVLHPAVFSLALDQTLSLGEPAYSNDTESAPWNISQINADILWSFGFTGSDVVVALMDTGADLANPHLQSSWRGGSNSWLDATGVYALPHDTDGHGTQVLGIMVGSNDIDTPIGIAPSAKWIAAKIFNDTDAATFGGIHLAFGWLLDPDGDPNTNDAPHVVNCSWGLRENINQCVTEFQEDIELLRQAGIAVVFAAGNENVNPSLPSSISPANYPQSLSVGAVDNSSVITSSSSRGPSACDGSVFPKLVAPGALVETCDLSFGGVIDQHVFVDGTSFAAPHVSAAFALLMQAFPDANSLDIETAMIVSANDLGDAGPDNIYGHGQIDIYAAYQMLASGYCPADLNHNNVVDLSDLLILMDEWLCTSCSPQSPCRSDLNLDNQVNLGDFSIFASQHLSANNRGCP